MSRRAIERQEWQAFVDAFSRRHDGWLVSVAMVPEAGDRRYLARDVPLQGVIAEVNAEVNDGSGSMTVLTGGAVPYARHVVKRPVSLVVEETADGAEAELAIADDRGERTVIAFRSPMRPELVDGIA